MPRSNWKGVISFGLVSIPIVLYPIEKKESIITFHQVDKRDNSRIKYQRVNVNTGKIVPWEQITRAYEYDEDTNIPVPDNILHKIAGENDRTIAIETFIDKNELDTISISNSYYLVPGKGGDKGYVILRDALKSTKKVGIAKVIISTKEYLAAVMPYKNAIVLSLLRYHSEMRSIEELELPKKDLNAYKINKKEMEMANKLINSMSSKWRPEKFKDEYQQAIHKWVDESVKDLPHTMMKQRKTSSKPAHVINFMDLLKKSLETNHTSTKKRLPHRASRSHNHRHAVRHH